MLEFALLLLVTGTPTLLTLVQAGGHGHGHRHVIIHVPYKIKEIHHTHTITKHVHHKGGGDKYEVLGYTVGHPIDLSGDHGHDQSSSTGGSGHDLGGGHEYSGGHDFGGTDWTGGISESVKNGGQEEVNEEAFHGGRHSGLSGTEFFMGSYGGHEEFSSH